MDHEAARGSRSSQGMQVCSAMAIWIGRVPTGLRGRGDAARYLWAVGDGEFQRFRPPSREPLGFIEGTERVAVRKGNLRRVSGVYANRRFSRAGIR
jgi:hypothetical protein